MQDSESNNDLLKNFEPVSLESLNDSLQRQIQSAREIFNEFSRLIKSITLYGAEHQSSLNFRSRFFEVMTDALSHGDPITVEVETYALVIADQIIYEDDKMDGNFIYRFYNDGIRSLSFKPGIKSREVDQLLNLFFLDWSSPTLFEDDAVTMMWSQHFDYIGYSVAARYDEDTQEADAYLFNFTDELNRLKDHCGAAFEGVDMPPIQGAFPKDFRDRIAQLERVSQRELLEKLISLAHETDSNREILGGLDRFVQLLDQLAQLFIQSGEISSLERLMRQAFFVAQSRQREQMIERWAVPIFVQQLMAPLQAAEHPEALSSLSCLNLLGTAATPHIARALGAVTEGYVETLTQMMTPHLEDHQIELCRVVRSVDFLHNKRLLPMLLSSAHDGFCLMIFETGWGHEDQGVRYESLLGLPDRLYSTPHLIKALIEGLSDSYSKTRTLSGYRISKLSDENSIQTLKSYLDHDARPRDAVELRKLYAALAMMGGDTGFFVERLEKRGTKLSLSALSARVRDEQHSALVGLALSVDGEDHRALLERKAGRKLGGALVEPSRWGLMYLDASANQRDQMVYELFFRGQLSVPKGRSI